MAGYLNAIGDDHFDVYLNGELLFKQSGFVAHTVDARKLKKGKNVIAAVITNDKDIAGLLIYGEVELPDRMMTLVTDGSWKIHSPDIIDADDRKQADYDSSNWPSAAEISGVTTKNVWRRLALRRLASRARLSRLNNFFPKGRVIPQRIPLNMNTTPRARHYSGSVISNIFRGESLQRNNLYRNSKTPIDQKEKT